MKILLYGEYSGIHSNLLKAFGELDIYVDFLSVGDGFKNLKGNIHLKSRNGPYYKKIFSDLSNSKILNNISKNRYDITNFINPLPGIITPHFGFEQVFIKKIINNSEKTFMYASGCDFLTYETFSGLKIFNGLCDGCMKDHKSKICPQKGALRGKWYDYFISNLDGIYSGTRGAYQTEYIENKKFKGHVPFPIDIKKYVYQKPIFNKKLKVLHGINRYFTKGSDKILSQLNYLKMNYSDLFEIEVVEKLPFDQYLKKIYSSNIIVDQLYGDGLGMNALHSMSSGRIVLSSYDADFTFQNTPALKIINNNNSIVDTLLILSQLSASELEKKSFECHEYVAKFHDSRKIAKIFLDNWIS